MNTNIKVITTDDQRMKIAAHLGRTGMCTRDDVRLVAMNAINKIILGEKEIVAMGAINKIILGEPDEEEVHRDPLGVRRPNCPKTAPAFIPSRGDEDYLTQPKDPAIAAACHRILDDTALIEQFAWNTIERNRK